MHPPVQRRLLMLEKRRGEREGEGRAVRKKVVSQKTTLIVCPPSVFSSWITQLEEHIVPGSLKVYMYHGGERTDDVKELMKHDIVLTTYGTLAVEEAWEDSPVKKMEWPFLIKSYWQSLIQRPLGQGNKSGLSRLHRLLGLVMLNFLRKNRQLYDHMEGEAKGVVQNLINSGSLMRNYSTVLSIILRLRQLCDDISLCPPELRSLTTLTSIEDVTDKPELLQKLVAILQDGEDFDCPICISPPRDIIITRSKSSKVTALLSLLMASRHENPNTKSVVFSQFRKMLLLLETPLKAAGFTVLRLDGAMTVKKRTRVISDFGKPELTGPVVLLASLKASGAGINLTAASMVYLFEPWWNPAVEEQTMDRIHRIGQKQEVKMIRMIARNSIEERVLELQQKKKNLANEAFKSKAWEGSKRG
ncbi:hypothetical protein F2Q68_00023332 [Brassica cretica]|nr:hypothetical protein F2Q68_00023332 [Brassica cretica]